MPPQYSEKVIDAPVAQYTPIPPSFTVRPALPPLPSPAKVDGGACKSGCYSNDQVQAILDDVIGVASQCFASLDSIKALSSKAPTPKESKP